MTKILLGSRHGGHAASLPVIKDKLKEDYENCSFIVLTDYSDNLDYEFAEKVYKTPSWRDTGDDKAIKPVKFIRNFLKSFYVLIKESPSVVVAAGANTSFLSGLIAGLMRKKVIAVEAKNRVSTRSKTPSVLSKLSKTTVWVSHDELLDAYDTEDVENKGILQQQDFSGFESEDKDRELLVVPSSGDSQEIKQEYSPGLPRNEFLAELGRTETVVTRGGNTAYEAANLAEKVVVVPFPDPQGHQREFAEWLEEEYDNVEMRDEKFEEVIKEYEAGE